MFTRKQMSQNILRFECRRGVYRANIFKESRRGKLWEYMRLLFSTQKTLNYMELHKMRGDDDIFAKNIIADLNGQGFCSIHIVAGELHSMKPKVFLTIKFY